MNFFVSKLLFLAVLLTSTAASGATKPVPAAPNIAAKQLILLDFNSGAVLAEKNADDRVPPASITKVMTSYVVYKELAKGSFGLADMVPVSEKAWRMQGSRMFVEVGTTVSVEDLLRGLVIQSGNDASVALAEFVAGTEDAFADYMNHYAKHLGMENSHFTNSTGWPDAEHYMSARDIAILALALIRDFPEHYKMYSQKEYTYNNIPQYNRNKLLWSDDSVDGIKTGHTDEAGFCLVSSAQREGMRLVSVVLGSKGEKSRAQESQAMLSYGFRFFETHRLYAADEVLNEARIWKGAQEQISLGLGVDLYVTIPRGEYKKLKADMEVSDPISAPAEQYQEFGAVRVSLNDEVLVEQPLVALQAVAEGSLWQRLRDSVLQYFQ